jgi:galactonate dehydratase
MTNDNTQRRAAGRRRFLSSMAAGLLGTGVAVGRGTSAVSAWTGLQTNSVLNQARPPAAAKGAGLKIVKVEPLKSGVIGQSAWDIEAIWNKLHQSRNSQHGSMVQQALACMDIAMWDIVGQRLGVPVYRLLGGLVNDKLHIYTSYRWGNIPRTSVAWAKRTKELIAEGANAWKWDPSFAPEGLVKQVSLKTLHELVEMTKGIREGGPDFDICVEAHAKFNVASAVRIAKALEPYDPLWLEEPTPPEEPDAMAEVQRATSIPIAAGERIKSRLELRPYLEKQSFRVFQPDAAHVGGITD